MVEQGFEHNSRSRRWRRPTPTSLPVQTQTFPRDADWGGGYRISGRERQPNCVGQNYANQKKLPFPNGRNHHVSCWNNSGFSPWKPACIQSRAGAAEFFIPRRNILRQPPTRGLAGTCEAVSESETRRRLCHSSWKWSRCLALK